MRVSAEFNRPGMVPVAAGEGAWVSVQPWPEYGASGTPVWPVRVVAFNSRGVLRRFTLKWSTRLRRWTVGQEASRLAQDLTPAALRDVENAVRDVLEGALC